MEQKIEKVEDPADYKGGDSMGYNYEVGDIVTLKKTTSLWKQRVGDITCRCGFPIEMHGMRTSDYDSTETGRKKYKRFEEKRLEIGNLI